MDLPVLSAACERQGPTRGAIICPNSIHLVHAYYTHILIPEYPNKIILGYLQFLQAFVAQMPPSARVALLKTYKRSGIEPKPTVGAAFRSTEGLWLPLDTPPLVRATRIIVH